MNGTIRRLDPSALASVAHLLLPEERQALVSDSDFGALGYFADEVAAGVLLFRRTGHFIEVSRVYVSASYRNHRIATALLRQLADFAEKRGFQLSAPFAAAGINDAVYRLMRGAGLSMKRQPGFVARVSREALLESLASKKGMIKPGLPGIFEISAAQRREFSQHLRPRWEGIATRLRYGLSSFSPASSCALEGGSVKAASLITLDGHEPEIAFLYAQPGHGRLAVSALVCSVFKLTRDTEFEGVSITLINDTSVAILNRLCGDYEIVQRLYTAYATGL